jgi:import receptor subunit TOM70
MAAKQRGNKQFKDAKYEAAIECYSEAIKLCPQTKSEDMATFYQNRAASYEMLKRYEEVIADCNQAIKYNKKYTKALQRRAKAYESIGNIGEALNDITAACILDQFENQSNLLMTDRLLRQQSKSKAKTYVKNRTPTMPSKHFMRHYFMSYIRDPIVRDPNVDEESLQKLMKSLEEDRESDVDAEAKIYLLQGTLEILKGNIEGGEKELEKVIDMTISDNDVKVNSLIKLGTIRVHEVDGNPEGINSALKCFEDAIALDPNNPDIYIHRAQIFLLAEQIEEAKKDLETCCSLTDSFPSAVAQKLYVQFRFAIRAGYDYSVDQAIKGFNEALEQFPDSSEVHSLYAQSLMERQDFNAADEYFLKAVKCDPQDANLYVHRGILQLQWCNDTEKAVKLLEKALSVDSKCQFAYEMLGSLEVQRGNLSRGITCFEQALSCAQTELDCAHLYSLRDAAEAQLKAAQILGIELPK